MFKNIRNILVVFLIIIYLVNGKVSSIYAKNIDFTNITNIKNLENNDLYYSNNYIPMEYYNTPSKFIEYSHLEYMIDKYDVNIIVNENNTFDITETITAYFNEPKHGISRMIPLYNKITRQDGTTSKNQSKITNLSVNNEYTTFKENGNYVINIGSKKKTLTGSQTYVIKYTYNIGKDPLKNCDELYYNIIGSEWNTVIGNITFNITMPKEFDSNKLGFSSGPVGSTDNSKIKYVVNENTISGMYDGILGREEALTVRCELNEGYFKSGEPLLNIMNYSIFLIPILFLLISIFLVYKYGREDKVVETVEFYPPKGFNSLEIGFIYKGKADYKDVTSLLIYLANKGYIKISEIEGKAFPKGKGFKVTKLKEYDGNNINEQVFLKGLFKKSRSYEKLVKKGIEFPICGKNEVTSLDISNNFYNTMIRILSNINSKENKKKIFNRPRIEQMIAIILMIILTFCLITIVPSLEYGNIDIVKIIIGIVISAFTYTMMFKLLIARNPIVYIDKRAIKSKILTKLFVFLFGISVGGVCVMFTIFPAISADIIYLIGYIIGLLCVFGMLICLEYLPKRTAYGNEILGKIKGFKSFIETAEKERLEAMIMEDPTYFYNILPFTYALGISNKWMKKFESIDIKQPNWYDNNSFDFSTFNSFIDNTMNSTRNFMSSSPSSDTSSFGDSSSGRRLIWRRFIWRRLWRRRRWLLVSHL